MEFPEQRVQALPLDLLDDGVATVAVIPGHEVSLSPHARLLQWAVADQARVVDDLCERLAVELERFDALLRAEVECREDEAIQRKAGDRAEV